MPSGEVQGKIVQALKHGPAGLFELADSIDQPPFRVRAELKALARKQLVYGPTRTACWRLTDRGTELAWRGDQLTLLR